MGKGIPQTYQETTSIELPHPTWATKGTQQTAARGYRKLDQFGAALKHRPTKPWAVRSSFGYLGTGAPCAETWIGRFLWSAEGAQMPIDKNAKCFGRTWAPPIRSGGPNKAYSPMQSSVSKNATGVAPVSIGMWAGRSNVVQWETSGE